MRAFNKTAATLVRPHPFSTLCTTPLGKMWVCDYENSNFAKVRFYLYTPHTSHRHTAAPSQESLPSKFKVGSGSQLRS